MEFAKVENTNQGQNSSGFGYISEGVTFMSWSCPHHDEDYCKRRENPCEPGTSGCGPESRIAIVLSESSDGNALLRDTAFADKGKEKKSVSGEKKRTHVTNRRPAMLHNGDGNTPPRDVDSALKLALSLDIPFWPQPPIVRFEDDM